VYNIGRVALFWDADAAAAEAEAATTAAAAAAKEETPRIVIGHTLYLHLPHICSNYQLHPGPDSFKQQYALHLPRGRLCNDNR